MARFCRRLSILLMVSSVTELGSSLQVVPTTTTTPSDAAPIGTSSSAPTTTTTPQPSVRSPMPRGGGDRLSSAIDARSGGRSYCGRCHRPPSVCLCHSLPPAPIDSGARVLILQHPQEARKKKRTSTVPLIGLCMEGVDVCKGTHFTDEEEGSPPALREALDDPGALLLYPGDGAVPLEQFIREEERIAKSGEKKDKRGGGEGFEDSAGGAYGKGRRLIVVDGTWAQTQGIIRDSPCLGRFPRVMFDDRTTSLFDPIRREPASHCTSTLEAVSRALRLVGTTGEAWAAADAMEGSLRALVDGQLRFALHPDDARPRYKRDGEVEQTAKGLPPRRKSSRRRRAQLSLRPPKTASEIERDRIRFILVAHLG